MFDNEHKIFIINPNIEIILLLVRHIIKNREFFFRKKNLNGGYLTEFSWLLSKINIEEVYKHCIFLFDEDLANTLIKFINSNTDMKLYNSLKEKVLLRVNRYRTMPKTYSIILYLSKKFKAGINVFLVKKLYFPRSYRRFNPNGGRAIVFIGVDGSGKSTLILAIKKWLTWKVDVYDIYFGSGAGKSSFYRYPFLKLVKLVKRNKNINKSNLSKEKHSFYKEKEKSFIYRSCRFSYSLK